MRYSKTYGEFGGSYVPEMLQPALDELEAAFLSAMNDKSFLDELA